MAKDTEENFIQKLLTELMRDLTCFENEFTHFYKKYELIRKIFPSVYFVTTNPYKAAFASLTFDGYSKMDMTKKVVDAV